MNATLEFTITQSAGDLAGGYTVNGFVSDGSSTVDFNGAGVLSGAVALGDNPAVIATMTPGACPNVPGQLTGTCDSANNQLTLVGPTYVTSAWYHHLLSPDLQSQSAAQIAQTARDFAHGEYAQALEKGDAPPPPTTTRWCRTWRGAASRFAARSEDATMLTAPSLPEFEIAPWPHAGSVLA